jgi:orotidine-5'-phosphate decarboxylase
MGENSVFVDRLIKGIEAKRSPCVVGLDTAIELMPMEFLIEKKFRSDASRKEKCKLIMAYNKLVIDEVADLVPAVKPNSGFYEIYGGEGLDALEQSTAYARAKGLLVILDAKRGDIGSTSEMYARAHLAPPSGYDALTISPYLGDDSIEPVLKVAAEFGKGLFILVKTSNKGSALFQDLQAGELRMYEHVARYVQQISTRDMGERGYSNIGAVVGATWPEHAEHVRKMIPSSFFLVPGYGAQGGELSAVSACFNKDRLGAIVNSSRGVIFPHLKNQENEHYRVLIRQAAEKFVADIRGASGW